MANILTIRKAGSNKFPAQCACCGQKVPARAGNLYRTATEGFAPWYVIHSDCREIVREMRCNSRGVCCVPVEISAFETVVA